MVAINMVIKLLTYTTSVLLIRPFLTIIVLTVWGLGCRSAIITYDPKTGKSITTRADGAWGSFTHVVDREVARERSGAPPPNKRTKGWRDYWIARCETLYHRAPDQLEADRHIAYVVDKRHQEGLPNIPEIARRQFRTRLQMFKDNVDWAIEDEKSGQKPATYPFQKTWAEHWKWRADHARNDPQVGEAGLDYIREQRRKGGLPDLQ